MAEEKESVVVVGARPTLPNQQVDMAEECDQNLRCRGTYYLGSSPSPPNMVDHGLAASTPAQASPPGVDEGRRAYPCFGTPGSLADMCPDQSFLHLPPLEVKESPIQSPSPPNIKLNLDQTHVIDSGYGFGTDISHGDSCVTSRRSSMFDDPFSNPEGSYVSNKSIWEMFTPIRDLKKKWRGKPSYLDNPKDISFVDKFSLEPQQILGFLMLVVIFASVGFMFLISYRNVDDANEEMNNKYKSIEYGRQKQMDRLRGEGRLLEEVRDEDGNLLGGKKAAIQFSYDQEAKLKGDKDIIGERGEDNLKVEDPTDNDINVKTEEKIGLHVPRSNDEDYIKTEVEIMTDDDRLRDLENEVKELEEERIKKLALIEKVKMFNKQVPSGGPKPRKFRIVDGLSLEVKLPEESEQEKVKTARRRKSPANPLVKSLQKKLKMSKRRTVQSTS